MESRRFDVVVVGSCMIDLVSYVPRLPKPGETIHGRQFSRGFGGKGANQCVTAARLGAKTAMVAKVGDDIFGKETVENFRCNSINTDEVQTAKNVSTGVAPIAVNDAGENSIIIVSGANGLLTPDDVVKAKSFIETASVVVCQLEIPAASSLRALSLAKKAGAITILNPAPGIEDLDENFYEAADIICPNETEAEILTGKCVKSREDAEAAAESLVKKGCKTAVVTLGSQGLVCVGNDGKRLFVKAEKVQAVDTTGAGDSFVGALAFYLATMPHLSFAEKLERAAKIAAVSVQKPGTQTSFPKRGELSDELFT
ncbi:ribokinase-like [Oscarella lobularis]|uniref:ribokinase-like n=1 Tax=Oscarella lobularis TaxID=121494 RepID=UPI003313B456